MLRDVRKGHRPVDEGLLRRSPGRARSSSARRVVDQKSKAAVHTTLDAQDADLQKQQTAIADKVSQFNEACPCESRADRKRGPGPALQALARLPAGGVRSRARPFRRPWSRRQQSLPRVAVCVRLPAPQAAFARRRQWPRSGDSSFLSRRRRSSGYNQDAFDRKKTEQAEEIEYAKGLPQAQKATKDSQVRRAIDDFGTAYERAWEQYLRADPIEGDPPADPGAWIQALAQSGEWRTVLEPAADAVGLAGDPADPHFRGLLSKTAGTVERVDVPEFRPRDVHRLAEEGRADVARCQSNPAIAGQFRSALAAGDPSNSLVNADSWVDQNGGESLAQGSLRDLLQRPLKIAHDAVGASADPNKRWTELVRASQQLSHRYPFSGVETDDLATPDEVKAVLGGLSGSRPEALRGKGQAAAGKRGQGVAR